MSYKTLMSALSKLCSLIVQGAYSPRRVRQYNTIAKRLYGGGR